MLKGNKGERSELYVLFRLLSDGRVYAADSDLNRLKDVYFPIIKIIREEEKNNKKEYYTGETIRIYINNEKVKEVDRMQFEVESDKLLEGIKSGKNSSFSLPESQAFIDDIYCYKIKAPSSSKSDITMEIRDIYTGYSPQVGFSIKSELGSSPTLLNAGKSTNFIYRINHNSSFLVQETNGIYKKSGKKNHIDVRGRIEKIISEKGKLEYYDMYNSTFKDNLVLIDSNMDKIIAETVLYYYRDGIVDCEDMVNKLENCNPMNFGNTNAYRYKFKKFLTSVALGMKPATVWDGIDEATGGYIIVTRDGDVLAYHIYNRNYFEEYLLKNTKYETASTTRHDFGKVYKEGDKDLINLNLQVRFK